MITGPDDEPDEPGPCDAAAATVTCWPGGWAVVLVTPVGFEPCASLGTVAVCVVVVVGEGALPPCGTSAGVVPTAEIGAGALTGQSTAGSGLTVGGGSPGVPDPFGSNRKPIDVDEVAAWLAGPLPALSARGWGRDGGRVGR